MVKLVEIDEKVKLAQQMDEDVGPVILINKFKVNPEEVDQFLKVFAATTEIMKQMPGYISAQLHRGVAGSCVFVNYAVWESTECFKQAFNSHNFRSSLADLPPSTVMSPHLFKKVAVTNICVE
jgi:heme-degrading monooxygenase HmoA